jgi:hypothetical protein
MNRQFYESKTGLSRSYLLGGIVRNANLAPPSPLREKVRMRVIQSGSPSPSPASGRGKPFDNRIESICKAFGLLSLDGTSKSAVIHEFYPAILQHSIFLGRAVNRERERKHGSTPELGLEEFPGKRFPRRRSPQRGKGTVTAENSFLPRRPLPYTWPRPRADNR